MKEAKVGDFVFWDYHPGFGPMTYLAGVVTDLAHDGRVQVEGYQGYAFKPVYVTDKETGRVLFEKLKAAEQRQRRTINDANASFEAARDSLFKKNG